MTVRGIDTAWLRERVRESTAIPATSGDKVNRLRELRQRCEKGFCDRRPDVVSSRILWPRRALGNDEARSSFLRAVEHGLAVVQHDGCVTLPTVRPKPRKARYALLGKNGDGLSVNLEYLIQIGATAELIIRHGWPPESVDFEREESDALAPTRTTGRCPR